MNEVKELLGLKNKKVKVIKVEEDIKKGKRIKVVTVVGTSKKLKCPTCGKYTSSIHDTLKPVNSKYVKVAEYDCHLRLIKRRFVCHKCKKK